MKSNDLNTTEIGDNGFVVLKYYMEKVIDYNKLKLKYPEIYNYGLISTFSFKEASQFIDKTLAGQIIKDCIVRNPKFELHYKKKK
jgi:hypothetical protein